VAALTTEAIDISPFGRVFDLGSDGTDVVMEPVDDVVDRYTRDPVVTGAVHVGLTLGPALPFEVAQMERHPGTREGLLCIDDAVVVLLSADPGTRPSAASTSAVLVRPGQCLSLDPNVWHSMGLGLHGPSRFYWLAGVSESPESPWAQLIDGPVRVTGPEEVR
jgi:ureidoglycolate hydrolase